MSKTKIKVVHIGGHPLLAQSIANLLSKYDFIEDITTFATTKEFADAELSLQPDVILLNTIKRGISGMGLATILKKKNRKVKIILLSSVREAQTIRYALRNGASGFLSKDTSPEELAVAIATVFNDVPYIGQSLRPSLLKNTLDEEKLVYNLSPREKEVLNHVCEGKTIKEAAYDMGLSVNTVQTYYKTILKKFNLKRTANLIVFAMQNGFYIPPPRS